VYRRDICPDAIDMPSARSLFLIALPAAITVTRAPARDPGRPSVRLRTFCSADYVRLCPGVDLHRAEIVACFRKNIDDVSPGCWAAVAEYKKGEGRAARPMR
jgi:hypothetical protein